MPLSTVRGSVDDLWPELTVCVCVSFPAGWSQCQVEHCSCVEGGSQGPPGAAAAGEEVRESTSPRGVER